MPLSETQIRTATARDKIHRLADGGGLNIEVMPSGAKVWRLFYRSNGKQRSMTLGRWPDVTLEDARGKTWVIKQGLKAGSDPQGATPAEDGSDKFATVARAWWDAQRPGWSEGHAQRVWSRIKDDLLPDLGERGMKQITGPELLGVLRKIEGRGAIDSAKRIRQYAGAVFTYAVASGKADQNPAFGLEKAMKRAPKVEHQPALPLASVPEFFRQFHKSQSAEATKLAILLVAHTAVRRSEMNDAVWSEIAGKEWRIPAARMKMSRDHIIPLSPKARAILKRLRQLAPEGQDRVALLTSNAMYSAVLKMGFKGRHSVHGFRTWFSTAAYDSGLWSSEAIELALAHVEANSVKAAYNRALKLDERRKLLEWWSDWLNQREEEGRLLS